MKINDGAKEMKKLLEDLVDLKAQCPDAYYSIDLDEYYLDDLVEMMKCSEEDTAALFTVLTDDEFTEASEAVAAAFSHFGDPELVLKWARRCRDVKDKEQQYRCSVFLGECYEECLPDDGESVRERRRSRLAGEEKILAEAMEKAQNEREFATPAAESLVLLEKRYSKGLIEAWWRSFDRLFSPKAGLPDRIGRLSSDLVEYENRIAYSVPVWIGIDNADDYVTSLAPYRPLFTERSQNER